MMSSEILQLPYLQATPWVTALALSLFSCASASLEAGAAREDQRPLVIDRSPAEIVSLLARALEGHESWEVVELRPEAGRARLVHRSSLFRFPDDVEVHIEEATEGGVLQARSRSRYGAFDFGQNARNLRELSALVRARCTEEGAVCHSLSQ